MTEEAKAARKEYLRNWRKNNPDKVKANTARFWERKAAEAAERAAAEKAEAEALAEKPRRQGKKKRQAKADTATQAEPAALINKD